MVLSRRPAAALLICLLPLPPAAAEPLSRRIDAVLQQLGPHTPHSVRLLDARTGRLIYEKNPDLALMPASNMKLVTSAAAFAHLGPGYRFTTRLMARPPRQKGRIETLYLVGGGDPSLTTEDLRRMACALAAKGVSSVGELAADDSRYDDARLGFGWNWDDEPYYYSAQMSALTVNRGVQYVTVRPGAGPGDPARVEVAPSPGYQQVSSQAITGPPGGSARIEIGRVRGRNIVTVKGVIPQDAEPVRDERVTVEEPALYAAHLLAGLLEAQGIRVGEASRIAAAPSQAVEWVRHESEPLSTLAIHLNKRSDNLYAEMLLKEIGLMTRGRGSSAEGRETALRWMRSLGIPVGGLRISDGSGLSRLNYLTTGTLSELLRAVNQAPWRRSFFATLPVAGTDGTLSSRLKGTDAAGRLLAKTGTILDSSGLSGYILAGPEPRYILSFLGNNYRPPENAPPSLKRVEDEVAEIVSREAAEGETSPGVKQ